MQSTAEKFLNDLVNLSLPAVARTRSGAEYSPTSDIWKFRDGTKSVVLKFEPIRHLLHDNLVAGLKKTLIWYLSNRAPTTASTQFWRFFWLIRQIHERNEQTITEISPATIEGIDISTKAKESALQKCCPIIKAWITLRHPGMHPLTFEALQRLNLKQLPAGLSVATLDPTTGPLSDLEFESIQSELNEAYAKGLILTSTLLICHLLMGLGARPGQLAALKCMDIIRPEHPDGDFVLMLPSIKKKGAAHRDILKPRKLSRSLGSLLASYAEDTAASFVGILEDPKQAPLFPFLNETNSPVNSPELEHHATPTAISDRVVDLITSLRVKSERTEGYIHATPVRFRRTFATRAAEEGFPMLVIAELMDHTDTRHVQTYAALTARVRAQFSKNIAMEMAPLAMAFAGKIITSESAASRPDADSRIIDLRIDKSGQGFGSCGSYAHCGFARPMACYGGCYDFEPWLDGPHEQALEYMLAKRELLTKECDSRIASINDRAILGCAQVILRCRELMEHKHD